MTCKNCGNITVSNYCSECGQSTNVDRINFKNLLLELPNNIFQIDKGLFFTLKELSTRPGHSIREYLLGKRKNHFKPIAYLLILSTIYFLVTRFSVGGTFINDVIEGYVTGANGNEKSQRQIEILKLLSDNYAYTILFLLPVYSLASYLAFRRSEYNYFEHIVLNSYITGHQAILYSVAALLCGIVATEDVVMIPALILSVSFAIWTMLQFFNKRSRVKVFFLAILTYIISFVLIALLSGLLVLF